MRGTVSTSFGILEWSGSAHEGSPGKAVQKKPLHVEMEVKNAQKHGRDFTTQNKTNPDADLDRYPRKPPLQYYITYNN